VTKAKKPGKTKLTLKRKPIARLDDADLSKVDGGMTPRATDACHQTECCSYSVKFTNHNQALRG
jgi:hypothetical protein